MKMRGNILKSVTRFQKPSAQDLVLSSLRSRDMDLA